jgi:hypothetical protein
MNDTNEILARMEEKLKQIERNTSYVKWFLIYFLIAAGLFIIQGWIVKLFR